MSEHTLRDELDIKSESWFPVWRFVMRYVAPIAIAVISIASVIDQAQ
jgi:SNF family Na+-dependent transporter